MSSNIRITILPESSSLDENVNITINFDDSKMIGQKAQIIVETLVLVHIKDGSNEKIELLKKTLTITSSEMNIKVPANKLPYSDYQGKKITIQSQVRVIYKKKITTQVIFRTSTSKKPIPNENKDIIYHEDERNLLKNFRALPEKSQGTIRKIIYINISIILTFITTLLYFVFYFKGNSPIELNSDYLFYLKIFGVFTAAVFIICAIGMAVLIKEELSNWLSVSLNKKRLPSSFSINDYCLVSDLFNAKAAVNIDELTIQIAVCNMEKGMYQAKTQNHDGTYKSVVDDFEFPIREFILYEKVIVNISKNIEIGNYIDDKIYFEKIYQNLIPKNIVSENYGIDYYWEVKFIHKDFIDHFVTLPNDRFSERDF